MEYPKTVAAVEAGERQPWDLAYALLEEVPTTQTGRAQRGSLEEARKAILRIKGVDETRYSAQYLGALRSTAQWMSRLEPAYLRSMPTRAAEVAMGAGVDPERALELWQSRSWTLREWSKHLTGKDWSDGRPAGADAMQTWTPEQRAEAVEALAQDRDPQVRNALARTAAREPGLVRAMDDERRTFTPPAEPQPPTGRLTVMADLTKLRHGVRAALDHYREVEDRLDDDGRGAIREAYEKFRAAADLLGVAITDRSGVDWDAELARLEDIA